MKQSKHMFKHVQYATRTRNQRGKQYVLYLSIMQASRWDGCILILWDPSPEHLKGTRIFHVQSEHLPRIVWDNPQPPIKEEKLGEWTEGRYQLLLFQERWFDQKGWRISFGGQRKYYLPLCPSSLKSWSRHNNR